MPILSAEPVTFPESLLEEGPFELADRCWWVLRTKSRQEKALGRHLYERQVPYFLPLASRRLEVRGRPVTAFVPLFSGYVFLLADADERVTALTSNRVVQTLPVPDQGRLWAELRQIHRLLRCGLPIAPDRGLVPGVTVEIRSGPLTGLRGKVLKTSSGQRFVVQVDFIQQGASVVLEGCDLVEVKPEAARLH
jgi:transcriptional antiterminator RfaH